MSAYYNEFEPYAAQWLRNLIVAGHIAPGDVDERSITEVHPDDIQSYEQCHFFAGIGGWSAALRLAGWDDSKRVWTGSCPCQPFSVAGKGAGMSDERHLWPAWFHLISQCQPSIIFGEQVDAAIRQGWLDLVSSDLEGLGYAFGAIDLSAASVGAPHIRQRLWWVADADSSGQFGSRLHLSIGQSRETISDASRSSSHDVVGNAHDEGSQGRRERWDSADQRTIGSAGLGGFWRNAELISCRDSKARPVEPGILPLAHGVSARVGKLRAAGNAIVPQVAAEFIQAYMSCRP